MRAHVRFASVFVLGAAISVGCGGGSGGTGEEVETGLVEDTSTDTSGGEVEIDSGAEDSFNPMLDTGSEAAPDTSVPDTAPEATPDVDVDSGTPDTGTPDTGTPDTGTPDTGPPDTGPVDTGPACVVGAPCDDGDKCFTGKTLNAACACGGGTAVVCNDSNTCTTDTCETATGCKYTNVGDGTSCGAGKKCSAGVCADLCTVGAACDDANTCTTGETFDATCACTGGTANTCDDSNVCTTDSCNPTTGCSNAPVAEGTMCAAGKVCKSGGCVDPTASLPTLNIVSPTEGQKIQFITGTSCQSISTSIAYTAPNGFGQMRWRFVVPSSTNVGGLKTCSGLPAYGYFMDAPMYDGSLGGTFTEAVSTAGIYSGPSGTGRWWWCTTPGTGGMSKVSLNPTTSVAPGAPGDAFSTLSNYCYWKGIPGAAAPATGQWTLEVELRDKSGNIVTASRKFWLHSAP